MEIAITVSATVLGGIGVFVFGQIFVVLFLERIRTQARCVEDIAQALVMYGQFYSNPIDVGTPTRIREQIQAASTDTRRLAGLLRANAQTLPFYKFWRFLSLVLPKANVVVASRELILLSNVCPTKGFDEIKSGIEAHDKIVLLLGISTE